MKKAKKSLSQNFLTDKNITKKIIKQSKIKDQFIIEIGPGYGFLTDFIIKERPKKLILIEKDNALSNNLSINLFFLIGQKAGIMPKEIELTI